MADEHGGTAADGDGHVDAAPLIEVFGGIRPMASKLGVPVSTVQGWRERNAIPLQRLDAIRDAANKHDIDLAPEHVVLQVGDPPGADGDDGAATANATAPADDDEPAKPARSGGGLRTRAAVAAAGVALVVTAIAVTVAVVALRSGGGEVVQPTVPDGVGDRLLALEEAGESATARVAALEALVADNAALTDEVAGLRDRLAATEDALTAAQAALATAGDNAGAGVPDEVLERLAAVEDLAAARPEGEADPAVVADVAALREQSAATADAMAVLSGRISELAQRPSDGAVATGEGLTVAQTSAVAQALAVARLRQRFSEGGDIDAALAAAARLMADDAGLTALVGDLEGLVGGGVASHARLREGFAAIERTLFDPVVADDAGWLDRAQARVASVVSVQRTDAPAVSDDDGGRPDVAAARQRLVDGDLAGAVALVGPVIDGGAGGGAAAAWLAAARHRLAAAAALDALDTAVVDRLGAG